MDFTDPKVIACIAIGIAIIVGVWYISRQRSGFTRTCLTADTNGMFVRTPVDYAFQDITQVPEKIGKEYPHWMADITDELQPLDHGPINLLRDEDKLWNPNLLWKQYEHNWRGCGNGKAYIVNDEKTRFSLAEIGDIWLHRELDNMRTPAHGPKGNAVTEMDYIRPEPFDRLYGGSGYLPKLIGDGLA